MKLTQKIALSLLILSLPMMAQAQKPIKYAVAISANAEWRALMKIWPNEKWQGGTPYGQYFLKKMTGPSGKSYEVLFFHEGWGKVDAAGATQYLISRWQPRYLFNLGTCGGFEGKIKKFEVVLAQKTVIYDIVEKMGDSKEAIDYYSKDLNIKWLGNKYPTQVIPTTLVSADKDLFPQEIKKLAATYSAIAGDWETGAIAHVAAKNKVKTIILRGVTDVVNTKGGEAYGNFALFEKNTKKVMKILFDMLPKWLEHIEKLE
ncbi:MAG TPA: hypothetical protein DCS93_31780 [Microscillaceae bacterium]|nr:hypothetical protein [Microscillaceae bacterium]